MKGLLTTNLLIFTIMIYYKCKKCHTQIADTSLSLKELDEQIWEHFCSFHAENQDLDALTVFRAYLSPEE